MKARSPSLLLVEDDPADVALVKRAARECSPAFGIEVARDGQEAIEMLAAPSRNGTRPSLVLLDLKLPRLNGFQVLDAIRADERLLGVPVVVYSASEESADIAESYRRGATSYISKPQGYAALVSQLQIISSYWLSLNLALPG